MKNEPKQPQTVWRKIVNFLQDQKTKRFSRISYDVLWNLILLFVIVTILGFSFAGGVGAGYFASLVKDEPVRSKEDLIKDIYNYEETSEVFFANEVYLGKLKTDLEREEVALDQVSNHLINAVIATEDEYFYEHDGVVPKALLRAIFQEMTNASVQSGGSTLTQQLIKNQVLTNEVSFNRKAKEILLAMRVEHFFEKDEILQTYLNVSTFGRNSSGKNIAGVQAAAQGIFGVNAKDLNLPQSAFIAGLPQSPFGYTPYKQDKTIKNNLEPGLNRLKTVLKRMHDGSYISDKEYEDALAYDIAADFIGPKVSPIEKYPWLTVEIEQRSIEILSKILAENDGYEESDIEKDEVLKDQYLKLADRNLRQNGYKIYSTIDKDIYDKMQEAKDSYPYYGVDKNQEVIDPETKESKIIKEQVEVGAILIENKTGKILSFVGGRDHEREQTNHATNSVRPNGSTMKPLLVYAPAMELGRLSPGSMAADVPIAIPDGNKVWRPNNYSGGFTGITTARNALAKSHNIPAITYYMDILAQKPADYLVKMGFSTLEKDDYSNASMALGAMKKGVTVEENVNAYATFANNGQFIDAYMIDKIETKDGEIIYQHVAEPVDVFSPQTAYLTIDMMRDVLNSGTAASVKNRMAFSADWAGKTGTGNKFQDAWFVATNPNVTFGTWLGYDTPKSLKGKYKGLEYNKRNIYLWADLMNAAYAAKPEVVKPANRFEMPGGIVRRSFCSVSGLIPSEACIRAGMVETDLFNAKYVPKKVDDSFIDGKFVQAGEKKYAALDITPSEFVNVGFMLNPDYLERLGAKYIEDKSKLIPNKERWGNFIIPDAILRDNGKVPAPPSIILSGSFVVWNQHAEGDVVGYRVYRNGQKVGSVKAGSALTFNASGGSISVTAVDVAGKESGPSNIIGTATEVEVQVPPETEPTRPADPAPEKPKPTNPAPVIPGPGTTPSVPPPAETPTEPIDPGANPAN